MNNSDLAERLASDHGLTKADARKLVDAIFVEIGDAAAKADEISLNGFGKFKVKDTRRVKAAILRRERLSRSPLRRSSPSPSPRR
jgi:nucleoid DNA-binding protein